MAKLMLVEDDNNLREIYEARLQAEGYDIVTAKDGEEGLTVAKSEKPDLVISDVMMPKISGFEMLDILRNTEGLKNVKVIMLTALGQSDDQQRADQLGADRYLVKSQVTLEDIVKAAHELLEDEPAPEIHAPAAPEPVPVPQPAPEPPVTVAEPPTPSVTEPTPIATPPPVPVTPPAAPAAKTEHDASEIVIDQSTGQVSEKEAQSSIDEEAEVVEKIQNFVAGASTEATTPSAEFKGNDGAINTKDINKAAIDSNSTHATTAVKDDSTTNAVPTIKTTQSAVRPEPEPDENKSTDLDNFTESDTQKNDNVTIAHKKVIMPPTENAEKPDIQELFALEQAREVPAQPSGQPNAVIADDKGTTTKTIVTSPPGEKTDPNSIAL
jgi:DNA-binding response OmpR family regulator